MPIMTCEKSTINTPCVENKEDNKNDNKEDNKVNNKENNKSNPKNNDDYTIYFEDNIYIKKTRYNWEIISFQDKI